MSERKIPTPRAGEILKETIDDLGISQYRLAAETGIPQGRISGIIHGRNGITPAIALRLSAFLGSSCDYWLNLQRLEDVERAREALAPALAKIARFPASSLPTRPRRRAAAAPARA